MPTRIATVRKSAAESSGRRRGQFGNDGFQQPLAEGAGLGKLRFEPIDELHELLHLRDNAALLGEGRDRNRS
jgi:hypothetical protein